MTLRLFVVFCVLTLLAAFAGRAYEGGFLWFAHPDRVQFTLRGVDVSHHQGAIDWQRVAADDVSFAYLKATEGGDWTDVRFTENWAGAAEAELGRGAYHYFTLCTSGESQAEHFIATVPNDPQALPPVVDIEFGGNCGARPTPEAFQRELDAMTGALRDHFGKEPILYVTTDFLRVYPQPKDAILWRRSLFKDPGGRWVMWQFRNRGRVEGIMGPVDLNVASEMMRKVAPNL